MQHVYVIDDNKVVAMALSDTLQRLGYSTEVYNDPLVFLRESMPVSPAVILLDMRMPSMSGVELQKRLLELGRKTPIIFISGEWQSSEIVMGMKQGALDFLFKPFNLDELLTVIQKALSKDLQHSLATSRQLSMRERYNSLTPREKEVCALLVAGLLSKQVAAQLGITNATIKVHKSRVLEKMQTTSLQQLALAMQQLNLP
ncbi:response regulator [uncultured Limnohabitans sp.]|uniref:response regulator transcription factor n=1 Tax=uncultured Limnohabitans sp. TaxID=768543 RepID=UPI00262B9403|nr:response regulator [uncultured Limnohabitans sp.]